MTKSKCNERHGGRRAKTVAQGGFTLLEILVTLTVTLIGLTGLMQLHTTMTKSNQVSSRQLEATNIAEDALEDVRGMNEAELIAAYGAFPATIVLPTQQGRNNMVFRRTLRLTKVGVDPLDLIRLRIEVGWTDDGATQGSEDGMYDHTIAVELLRSEGEDQ